MCFFMQDYSWCKHGLIPASDKLTWWTTSCWEADVKWKRKNNVYILFTSIKETARWLTIHVRVSQGNTETWYKVHLGPKQCALWCCSHIMSSITWTCNKTHYKWRKEHTLSTKLSSQLPCWCSPEATITLHSEPPLTWIQSGPLSHIIPLSLKIFAMCACVRRSFLSRQKLIKTYAAYWQIQHIEFFSYLSYFLWTSDHISVLLWSTLVLHVCNVSMSFSAQSWCIYISLPFFASVTAVARENLAHILLNQSAAIAVDSETLNGYF